MHYIGRLHIVGKNNALLMKPRSSDVIRQIYGTTLFQLILFSKLGSWKHMELYGSCDTNSSLYSWSAGTRTWRLQDCGGGLSPPPSTCPACPPPPPTSPGTSNCTALWCSCTALHCCSLGRGQLPFRRSSSSSSFTSQRRQQQQVLCSRGVLSRL